jgi:hypothetical protein
MDNKEMDKNIEGAVQKMLETASMLPSSKEGPKDPVALVSEVAHSLEQGMMDIYKGLNTLGQGLDLSRLQNFMTINILLDKGIVTKDEIEERYKTEVADKLKEMQEQLKAQLEKEIEKAESTE